MAAASYFVLLFFLPGVRFDDERMETLRCSVKAGRRAFPAGLGFFFFLRYKALLARVVVERRARIFLLFCPAKQQQAAHKANQKECSPLRLRSVSWRLVKARGDARERFVGGMRLRI